MRILTLISIAFGVLAIAAAAIAALTARHFYFKAKLAAAEPVAFHVYSGENRVLRERDQAVARHRPRIVVIGDSRAEGMRLEAFKSNYEVINRGIGGETTAQLALRFADDALALKPDLVVIQSGMNDLVAGIGSPAMAPDLTERTIRNLKSVAEQAAAGGAKVLVLTVIPPARPELLRRPVWSEAIRVEVAKVNAGLLAWQPPTGVQMLDLNEVFGSPTVLPAECARDTLHLNPSGYARIEDKLTALIPSLLR